MNKKNIVDNSIFFEKIYKKADFFNLKYSVPSVVTSEDVSNHYIKVITSETDIENFSVKVENEKLIINCGDHCETDSDNNNEIYEKYMKSYEKTMTIPENSDINNIKTKLFNGIFTLTIPKAFCFYD